MRKTQYEYNQDFEDDVIPLHQRDDTFSSTPMNDDDVYTQRRMLMMRQMSAP
jgi:hypothetical protein